MDTPLPRDLRAEATALLPDGHSGLVLVPSPPADQDPQFFADDPTSREGVAGVVVSPVSDGDLPWSALAATDPAIEAFALRGWLGPHPRLEALPDGYAATRAGLHQIAFFAVAPARHAANGKIGLRWTPGGFGTPFFKIAGPHDKAAEQRGIVDRQVRVEGDRLVVQDHGDVSWSPLTTVAAAAAQLGVTYDVGWFPDFHDPLAPTDPQAPLAIDVDAVAALDAWFGFATSVLEELRRTPGAREVSRVQLWPEHFDPAVELGEGQAGGRASYGASPGDASHPEPYLYISPWGTVDTADPFWSAAGFTGALLPHAQLLEAADQRQVALEFLREGHSRLNA